jgi:hypothetical protein
MDRLTMEFFARDAAAQPPAEAERQLDEAGDRIGTMSDEEAALMRDDQPSEAEDLLPVRRALGFFACVIKSGEGWSQTAQEMYEAAWAALDCRQPPRRRGDGDEASGTRLRI